MELGTTLFHEKSRGIPAATALVAAAGFRRIDFDLTYDNGFSGGDEEKYFLGLKRRINDLGVTLSQAHAPYLNKISTDPAEYFDPDLIRRQQAAIRRAAFLGSPYLVFHPYIPYTKNCENEPYDYEIFRKENFERNLDFFGRLEPSLREYGVRGALENTVAHDWVGRCAAPSVCCTSKETAAMIDALGDSFCACLDAGHLNLLKGESLKEYVEGLGSRLKVLHLHDNFGALSDWFGELDRHLPPYFGSLKWQELVAALKENNFTGVFSFECIAYAPEQFDKEFAEFLFRAGKTLLGEA